MSKARKKPSKSVYAPNTLHENVEAHTLAIIVPSVIEQIKAALEQLVPVKRVRDLTVFGPHLERELALVKVAGTGDHRIEALRIADVFRANPLDSTLESFVFEITGTTDKVDAFVDLMKPLGLVDVSRTGIAAISRGASTHDDRD